MTIHRCTNTDAMLQAMAEQEPLALTSEAPPAQAEPATASLGLQLITALVRQLHGSIAMQNHLGTQFTIKFPGEVES